MLFLASYQSLPYNAWRHHRVVVVDRACVRVLRVVLAARVERSESLRMDRYDGRRTSCVEGKKKGLV